MDGNNNKAMNMNNKLTYKRDVEEDTLRERSRAQKNIDWFNRTVEGWDAVVTVEERGVIRTKYVKPKRHGNGR